MALNSTVDSEFAKLLSARALANSGRQKEAWDELDTLNLSYFPSHMALKLERGLREHRKRGSAPVPRFAATRKIIDEAVEYFTAVNKVALSAAFPEMSQQVAVNAINTHWLSSNLFYLVIALIVLVIGGSIYGETKIDGIGSELATAKANADAAQTLANAIQTRVKTQGQDADTKLSGLRSGIEQQSKRLQDTEGKIDTQISTAAAELGTNLQKSLQNRQGELVGQLNTTGITANGSVTDAAGAAVKKIQDAADQYVGKPLAKAISDRIDRVSKQNLQTMNGSLLTAATDLQGIETDRKLAESESKDIHAAWCALHQAPEKRRGHETCP